MFVFLTIVVSLWLIQWLVESKIIAVNHCFSPELMKNSLGFLFDPLILIDS